MSFSTEEEDIIKELSFLAEKAKRLPNYSLFKNAEIRNLLSLSTESSESLKGKTLEDLLTAPLLEQCPSDLVKREVAFELKRFLIGLTGAKAPSHLKGKEDENDNRASLSEENVIYLNSVQAEQVLKDSYAMLKGSAFFNQIAEKRLGEFWQSKTRAPFIEDLTFKGLLSIPVATLLKKRGVTSSKILGIKESIEKALKEAENQSSFFARFFRKTKKIFKRN